MYSSLCLQNVDIQEHMEYNSETTQKALVTCAWKEVVSVFVEWHGHDPVCEVEGFLYTVAMVNVNINV